MAKTGIPKKRKKMALSSQHRLIGQFIWHWNLFERALDDAVVRLCKLDELYGLIVTANLTFQPKMNIITTVIELLGRKKTEEWKEEVKNAIARIHTINQEWRTLVAHNLIVADDTKSVRFIKHTAKRKLDFPRITKTKAQFSAITYELFELGNQIEALTKDITNEPKPTISALARALSAPTPTPFAQALQGFLHPPSPETRSSSTLPAIPGTGLGMLANLFPKEE